MPKKRKTNFKRHKGVIQGTKRKADKVILNNVDGTIDSNLISKKRNLDIPSIGLLNIIRGTRHQGDAIYLEISRGKQCTACAVASIAYSLIKSITEWVSADVDLVLDIGDRLYVKSINERANRNLHDYLMISEVSKTFVYSNYRFVFNYSEETDTYFGLVDQEPEPGFPNLRRAIENVFDNANEDVAAVLTCCSLSIALFKTQRNGDDCVVSVYDSHSRNECGMSTQDGGVACLTKMVYDVSNLVDFLKRVLRCSNNDQYSLTLIHLNFRNVSNEEAIQQIDNVDDNTNTVVVVRPDNDTSLSNFDIENEFNMINDFHNRFADGFIKYKAAIGNKQPVLFYLGTLGSNVCNYCGARFFPNETINCCSKGEVCLPDLNNYPELLTSLLTDNHPKSKQFVKNILKYNNMLAMACLQSNLRSDLGPGVPVIVISGAVYQRIMDVHPDNTKFGTLYFLNADEAAEKRNSNPIGCELDSNLLKTLDATLRAINPFVNLYMTMRQKLQLEEELARQTGVPVPTVSIRFHVDNNLDRRLYNAPTNLHEVGAVYTSRDGEFPLPGEISVYYRNTNEAIDRRDISMTSSIADPLCFPLLFPRGELGWEPGMLRSNNRNTKRQNISCKQYYAYRFLTRSNFDRLLYAGKLTQQFFVRAQTLIEGQRLLFIRMNQQKLGADNYTSLIDYCENRAQNINVPIGRRIILPSTFTNGPRFMRQNYHDAMRIVTHYGKPHLFITFTCNPKWNEITNVLRSNYYAQDRSDVVARVFRLKLKELIKDLAERGVFGKVAAYVWVIEFQKRGLPHAHIILTLENKNAFRDPSYVDTFISAEIPDKETDQKLYEIVTRCMIHGPCGSLNPRSPCMMDNVCTKKYPKKFSNTTDVNGSYPIYRRRNDGRSVIVRRDNRHIIANNTFVVPYNPYLCLKYDAHINVECVTTMNIVKYLFKYIYKGPDQAEVIIENEINEFVYDEVTQFQKSRYLSSPEAIWRIFSFKLVNMSHTVISLPVHLPNERIVYFNEGCEANALDRARGQKSELEAWFELNRRDSNARNIKYADIPLHYRFVNKKSYEKRKRHIPVLSRMHAVTPKDTEKFNLRILLLHVIGAQSFDDLKTVDGKLCNSFQESARLRGFLNTDDVWIRTMEESEHVDMPNRMRRVFCYILTYCTVSNPLELWNRFKLSMSIDYIRRGFNEEISIFKCYIKIKNILLYLGKPVVEDFTTILDNIYLNNELLLSSISENNYCSNVENVNNNDNNVNIQDLLNELQIKRNSLNNEQNIIFDAVMNSIEHHQINSSTERYIYVQGSGGTGKTYLYNTILLQLELKHIPYLAVASTGIAALLLRNGKTVHSAFSLPLHIDNTTTSNIKLQSEIAANYRNIKLILWDEISMASYLMINVVDRLFRDLKNNQNQPFGGDVVILFGGDLRQLLPVADGRLTSEELCFMNCDAWCYFRVYRLIENLRADPGEFEFRKWLTELGEGKLNTTTYLLPRNSVAIPEHCLTDDIKSAVFGNTFCSLNLHNLSNRAILCSRNKECDDINLQLLSKFPGECYTLLSVDYINDNDDNTIDADLYQPEYLNSMTPTGFPPHKLTLKIGVPIMLMRNISLQDGLTNGTRLLIVAVSPNLITAQIITGRFDGNIVLIPKLDLTSNDKRLTVNFTRRQFPIKLCFAMTINKSQGQTFDTVGIYLPIPVFAHGQLYVAFSRVRNFRSVYVEVKNQDKQQGQLLKNNSTIYTKNIVNKNIINFLKRFVVLN